MSLTEPTRHPSPVPAVGYAVTVVCDATLLYLVNVWPGWQVVSFPTDDTRQVLGLVNLSLVAGLVANLVYLVGDAPVVKSLGELVTTGIGLAVLVRIWQVFPFDFAGWSVDWSWLVRRYGASYGGSTHRPSWTAASRCRSAGKDGRWRCRRDR